MEAGITTDHPTPHQPCGATSCHPSPTSDQATTWTHMDTMTSSLPIDIVRVRQGATTPRVANPGDAGVDLVACLDAPIVIEPGQRALIPTGIAIALPTGYAALVQPRSGLALKHGITVLNTPGLIDSGYRGEIGVVVFNANLAGRVPETTAKAFVVEPGMRIAQLVVQRVESPQWNEVDTLDDTQRGHGGFGSSGTTAPTGHH